MKKLLLIFAVAISVTACKNDKESTKDAADTPAVSSSKEIDEASYAFGITLGQQAERYNQNPALKDSLDWNEVEKGINTFLKSPDEQESYSYGLNIGKQINGALENKVLKGNINKDQIIAGMLDYVRKKDLTVSADSVNSVMNKFYTDLQKKTFEKNQLAGKEYMAKKATEEGVTTSDKGFAYKVISAGEGAKPTMGDRVKVLYEGKTLDGEVFDSTKDGEPREFNLRQGGLIKGWLDAMLLMPKGSKYEFYIPDSLAYGQRGSGNMIAPGETLVFNIELVDFVEGEETPSLPQPGVQIQPGR